MSDTHRTGKRDRGNQRIKYMASLSKLMAEQFLGEIKERQSLLIDTTDRNYHEETRHIKKGVDLYCKYFVYIILQFSRALLSHLVWSIFLIGKSCHTFKEKSASLLPCAVRNN